MGPEHYFQKGQNQMWQAKSKWRTYMKRSFLGKEEYLWQILFYVLYLEAKMGIEFEKQSLRGHKWFNYHSRESNKDMKSEPRKGKKCKII